MSYCNNCGAYIPDGQTKCLACGMDEAEETARAAQAKEEARRNLNSDAMREQLERQRRQQRENSRKWAEAERERREEARRYSESRKEGRGTEEKNSTTSDIHLNINGKPLAILSYLGILWILPFILCRDNDFAMYHAKQGLVLCIAGVVLRALSSLVGFSWLVSLLWIYMIFTGIGNANSGRKKPLPYIGNILS